MLFLRRVALFLKISRVSLPYTICCNISLQRKASRFVLLAQQNFIHMEIWDHIIAISYSITRLSSYVCCDNTISKISLFSRFSSDSSHFINFTYFAEFIPLWRGVTDKIKILAKLYINCSQIRLLHYFSRG